MKQSKTHSKSVPGDQSFLATIHLGFNYFHQINFPRLTISHKHRIRTLSTQRRNYSTKCNTTRNNFTTIVYDNQIQETLQENRHKLQKLKTEVNNLREQQFSEYIKKSIRYQGLLDINDHKKKRLPTLNAKVGQVIKKSLTDMNQKHCVYDATFIPVKLEGWKPQSREGHTCTLHKDNVVLIGGHCSHPFSKMNIYNLESHLWIKSVQTPTARSYHTSLLYKGNYIIVFGGMGVYNASRKCRQCFNSICLIDMKNLHSKIIRMTNEENIQPRRSHGAVLMGKYMMVLGGVNTKKEHLSDLVYLDLKDLRWTHKEFKIQGFQLNNFLKGGLARHAMIAKFKPRKSYPLYHADYTDQEGLFVFGGDNQQGQQNAILQMTFNRYVPVLKKVHYSGKAPSSIDPNIEQFNQNSILIISGDQYQREISIYQYKEQKFIQVSIYINRPSLGGLGSAMIHYKSCYYVFFGLGQEGYIGNVGSFSLSEKFQENQNKKKKEKIANQWKSLMRNVDSRGQSSLDNQAF